MKQAAFPLFETSERGPVILSCLWGGGGREGVQRIVGESNGFYWERRISHRQQSLKRGGGGEGGHWKTTYIALGRDQVNFIVAQLKSPDPIPP